MAKDCVMYSTEIYRQVARLHAANLDQGFLSSLGVGFLTELYRAIDRCPQSVLIVKSEQGKVVGFVAGLAGPMTLIYKRLMQRFLIWSLPLVPVLFSPSRMRRVVEILRYAKKGIPRTDLPTAELLSIVVTPDYRGNGSAEVLYADLIAYFKQTQVTKFKIVVGGNLAPAHKFYQRMGAQPLADLELHQGANSVVYVQTLGPTAGSS
jgi:ribosomal protein S18 acetylase RimI-like enzyme